jgi:hypothetical protein
MMEVPVWGEGENERDGQGASPAGKRGRKRARSLDTIMLLGRRDGNEEKYAFSG